MISIILLLLIGVYVYIDPKKRCLSSLHLLQLVGYDLNKYKNWLKEDSYKMFSLDPIVKEDKTPLVMTDRAKRTLQRHKTLNLFLFIALLAINIIVLKADLNNNIAWTIILIVVGLLIVFFQPSIMIWSAKLNQKREDKINMGFYKQAQNKIKGLENLTVVGITGSYGKTSTKFITSTILKEKYKVQDTPSSYNTPMGLSKVINNELTEDKEVFIAEMGAYCKGEIKECADLVQPQIGILTSIGPAHLETFGSIENIIATKYELIESLPEDGIAIFNYDDENLKEVAEKTKIKKYYFGLDIIDRLDVYAKDIAVSEKGSSFTLVIKDLGRIPCQTKILGRHNIRNILAGATAAFTLGLDLDQIALGISKIEPIDHRLSLIDSPNGVIIIDDGFNSNPAGARAALEVLNEFKNGKKIIVTPGMIELGELEYIENKKFGQEISKVADLVFLIGKKRTTAIREGLIEENFTDDNIFSCDSLNEATEIFSTMLNPGDVILFENDLPDNYSEEE
ncbi:UDP-N-acetylmuramoyl-tripeptide--D-alanyl-D-alanine ligase [Neofamilia massiliensis]|uniref:UDP-N-acetylmuramoyl-tripeptide--D-alanyl-D- alanine ligase n=1 Tax=Neofamilia massiliensis TaxID=1673724 RepID=UPI0006BB7A7F|nr:UDP-N-acetylmuramoyl-tripeptide--D-alanyl-D-alanine ligase [Neofamilia massiliensis]